jgi:hypothetical protein
MRSGFIGLVSAFGLALVTAAGCGSNTGATGTGGSSSSGGSVGTGGSSSSGGSIGTGGSSSSGGTIGTGLNALTSADATQLCKDVYAYFGKSIPMATACKYKGLSYATSSSAPSDAEFQQSCKDHEATCTQSGSGVGSATNPGCGPIPSTCTATVAEYSACISDEVTLFNQGVSGLPGCATAGSASNSAVWLVMVPTPPASCDSLANKCPDLTPPVPNN